MHKVIESKIIIANAEIFFKWKETDICFIHVCSIEPKILSLFYYSLWLWPSKETNVLLKVNKW